jgi:hypothetical protein
LSPKNGELDTSNLSNSGQAIYKEVNLSLRYSNKGGTTSDSMQTRKIESRVEEPKIIPSKAAD